MVGWLGGCVGWWGVARRTWSTAAGTSAAGTSAADTSAANTSAADTAAVVAGLGGLVWACAGRLWGGPYPKGAQRLASAARRHTSHPVVTRPFRPTVADPPSSIPLITLTE